MNARSVAVLAVLGVAALAGGWYFGAATAPAEQTTVGLMFPDLAQRLPLVTKLVITHQNHQTVIEKNQDGVWGVASMNDYPVQEPKLRAVLTALTELRLREVRTSDPKAFSRLGVDDPDSPESSADLVQLLDKGGKPIIQLIVGHRRVRSQGSLPEDLYVRRPDEEQSWLAEGNLQIDDDPALWLDRDVININNHRIASVNVNNDALLFTRTDGHFDLTLPAEHPKLEDYKVQDVARGLEALTFQTVKTNTDAPGEEVSHATFTTIDGLVVTVHVSHADKDIWVRLTAAGEDAAKAEADKLNLKLTGWSYQIGSWKEKELVPVIDDIKVAEPAAPDTAKK